MRERQVAAEMAERRAASVEEENARLREENDRLRDELRFLRTEVCAGRVCGLPGLGGVLACCWQNCVCGSRESCVHGARHICCGAPSRHITRARDHSRS